MTEQGQHIELRVGERHELTITDVAFGGAGVGRIGNFVVFVPFVLANEKVEVELTEVKRHFGRGTLVGVRRASTARVTPRCRYFGQCGGCQYQHMAYEEQLRLKRHQVQELMRRIGRLGDVEVRPLVPCPAPFGYRNRVMVRSQWNKVEQKLVMGFLRHDCRLVVDVEECAIAEPAINAALKEARLAPPPRGGLKVVLRTVPEGWTVPADSFFQTNRYMLESLVTVIRECLGDSGAEHLADVYCGVGFLAIELAGEVRRFVGVECDHRAIEAARQNAAMRGVTNGEFFAGLAEERLAEVLVRMNCARTAVVLDPPRVGCDPRVLAQIQAARPAQIVYVSCHPATLARDLNALCSGGIYQIMCVQPLDMFPQTQHAECVVDLRLQPKASGAS